jgi:murein DD-endopeptidase MepM/ murein hydrolase activator NlpD
MNDKNTEKNNQPEKNEKEKKSGNEIKRKIRIKRITGYSAYIYLALAICILTALTIGIFTMSYDKQTPSISIPEVSIPQLSTPSQPEKSEAPVGGEQSNVPGTIETRPTYANPIENGRIIKDFSIDTLVFSTTMKDYRVHTGVDIACEKGTAVHSFTDGTIAEIKNDPFYGTMIVIEHSSGLQTIYKNLNKEIPEAIKVGTAVKAGDIIGAVGDTAIVEVADEPHLHFEVRVGEDYVDPREELAQVNEE